MPIMPNVQAASALAQGRAQFSLSPSETPLDLVPFMQARTATAPAFPTWAIVAGVLLVLILLRKR